MLMRLTIADLIVGYLRLYPNYTLISGGSGHWQQDSLGVVKTHSNPVVTKIKSTVRTTALRGDKYMYFSRLGNILFESRNNTCG